MILYSLLYIQPQIVLLHVIVVNYFKKKPVQIFEGRDVLNLCVLHPRDEEDHSIPFNHLLCVSVRKVKFALCPYN